MTEKPEPAIPAAQRNERYDALLQAVQDVILVVGTDSQLIHEVNRAAQRVLGYTPEALVGQPISRLFAESGGDDAGPGIYDSVVTRQQFVCADGSTIWGELTFSQLDRDTMVFTVRDTTERQRIEQQRDQLIQELQQALAEVKRLSGLLPICANCKKIRDDTGYWASVESYIQTHTEATFSHGVCPECLRELYPDLADRVIQRRQVD